MSHQVRVEVDKGVAVYKVRRSFANNGKRADEASLSIDLPHGAAVTGLRIRARERWYDAELMEAEAAAKKYQELTSMGAFQPKDPALMQWVWPDRVHLQVFPVLPGAASTVEYTLTAPLHYRDGRYVLSYPRFEGDPNGASDRLPLAQPVLLVEPGHGDATTVVRVDGQRVPPQTAVVLERPPEKPWVGEGGPSLDASHVFSSLEISETGLVGSATVALDIDHTYRSDLRVDLITPAGKHLPLSLPDGSDNDVRGRFQVDLPENTSAQGTWHLMVSDQVGLDVGTLEAWSLSLADADKTTASASRPVGKASRPRAQGDTNEPNARAARRREHKASGLPLFIPDAPQDEGEAGLALIEIEPPPTETAQARFGIASADKDTNFLRLAVEAAPRLGEIPRKPSVVFVLDASRSFSRFEVQLALARAYLTHVPDAEVEIVVFRRHAERVFGSFVPAAEFDTRLERAEADGALALGNGSALELGLARAAQVLRGRAGASRIVLFTDALVRTRFRNQDAIRNLARAPRDTIVHIVIPTYGHDLELERDDTHALAAIPESTEGVLFGFKRSYSSTDKQVAAAVLGLVRPVQIDHFRVVGMPLADDGDKAPKVLEEGKSYRVMTRSAKAPTQVTVSGRVWNRRYRRVVKHGDHFDRATAAFVFSEDEYRDLSPTQMMTLAMYGRAVSPVTSYLAVEPGVRPSTAGIPQEGRGVGHGFGTGGFGTVGYGAGGGGAARKAWTIPELMADGIQACVKAHQPKVDWRRALDVETTWQEVVDVQLVTGARGGTSKAFDQCLVEAAWAIDLTWNFNDERHTYRVSLE